MRIVELGGGFGGVATVRHLERILRRRTDVEITLVSRENFFVFTPLLFEACSGRLELRHCAPPIKALASSKPQSNRLRSDDRSFEP
jgi:NADH:quinone reductase (non-electrogenic)